MNIPRDKQLHFIAGFMIYTLTYVLTQDRILAYRLSLAIGACKELVWDHYFKKGHACHVDFSYTVYGTIAGDVVMILTRLLMGGLR